MFESVDLDNDGRVNVCVWERGVLTFEEVYKSVYYILKADPLIEPESLEEATKNHTRNVIVWSWCEVGIWRVACWYDARHNEEQ